MIAISRTAVAAFVLLWLGAAPAPAAPDCTSTTFAAAVDKIGSSLRDYNAEAQPAMRRHLSALADKKGWSGEGREERALTYLEDGRLGELDRRANELLSKVDQLSSPAKDGSYDCSRLTEIEAASIEILAVMKTKAAYLEDKIAREVGAPKPEVAARPAPAAVPSAAPASPATNAPPAPVANAPPAPATKTAPAPKSEAPAAKVAAAPPAAQPAAKPVEAEPPKPAAAGTPPADDGVWDTRTKSVMPPPGSSARTAATPPPGPGEPQTLPPVTFETADEGYTIDEIRDATRGFFGTVSTNLASVIEYAFANSGRPTGYILGTEGGGAFLAGLRYGKGTLYLRQGGTRPIHWHGPSLGYDVGAEGGRTLILVYRMHDPEQLYRSFTGVDGSAYLVGGVGMTLLKGGDVIMAPIRSGLGLRLGANIGYLRFTSQPTWNPF